MVACPKWPGLGFLNEAEVAAPKWPSVSFGAEVTIRRICGVLKDIYLKGWDTGRLAMTYG